MFRLTNLCHGVNYKHKNSMFKWGIHKITGLNKNRIFSYFLRKIDLIV